MNFGPKRQAAGVVAAVLIAGLNASASLAQAPAPPTPAPAAPDDESTVVEALEVTARPFGPAMWRVTKGQSEVVILGAMTPLPHSLVWDNTRLQKALDGARELLIPPKPKLGPLDAAGFAFKDVAGRLGHADLEADLPPDLRARFVAARMRARQDPKRYAHWKPAVAGFFLISDYRRAAGLSGAKPVSTVEKLAAAKHVRVRPVDDIAIAPLLKAAANLSPEANLACLRDALTQTEHEGQYAQTAARAWATGDLKTVKADYSGEIMERCLYQLPTVAGLVDRGVADTTRQIQDALNRPGKTVAVVDLTLLLRRNGVLDRLQAQGATISLPLE